MPSVLLINQYKQGFRYMQYGYYSRPKCSSKYYTLDVLPNVDTILVTSAN